MELSIVASRSVSGSYLKSERKLTEVIPEVSGIFAEDSGGTY
jgi:hypothetical protein